jgi:hypothetical protein
MPVLVGFIDPARDAPGFLLPLFCQDRGANMELTQVVGRDDRVEGFLEIIPPGGLVRPAGEILSIDVGDPALWVFKDHLGDIHVGTAGEMAASASKLLMDDGLLPWPLVRLELAAFGIPCARIRSFCRRPSRACAAMVARRRHKFGGTRKSSRRLFDGTSSGVQVVFSSESGLTEWSCCSENT